MKIKNVLKGVMYLIVAVILGIVLLLSFYVWMIYGIHPSDEGTRSVACQYNPQQKKYTSIVITTIIDQKRVITEGHPSDCDLHLKFK